MSAGKTVFYNTANFQKHLSVAEKALKRKFTMPKDLAAIVNPVVGQTLAHYMAYEFSVKFPSTSRWQWILRLKDKNNVSVAHVMISRGHAMTHYMRNMQIKDDNGDRPIDLLHKQKLQEFLSKQKENAPTVSADIFSKEAASISMKVDTDKVYEQLFPSIKRTHSPASVAHEMNKQGIIVEDNEKNYFIPIDLDDDAPTLEGLDVNDVIELVSDSIGINKNNVLKFLTEYAAYANKHSFKEETNEVEEEVKEEIKKEVKEEVKKDKEIVNFFYNTAEFKLAVANSFNPKVAEEFSFPKSFYTVVSNESGNTVAHILALFGYAFPTDSEYVRIRNKGGMTVAHAMVVLNSNLNYSKEILKLADYSGNTVAHTLARNLKLKDFDVDILMLKNDDGISVAATLIMNGYNYDKKRAILHMRHDDGTTVAHEVATLGYKFDREDPILLLRNYKGKEVRHMYKSEE